MKRIEAALNTQLIANANSVAIAYQNDGYEPVDGTPYMRPTLLPATPDPWEIGAATNYHTGVYQVDLIYPSGKGNKTANAQADVIIAAFNQGTTLTYSSVDIEIKSSGRGAGRNDDNWYYVPVNIEYKCYLPN